MAKHKYGAQKIIQNDLQICINSFERMKRGGIGIADECVEDTCKRALKYIDELEAKLAESEPVRHGRWLKTDAYPHRVYCSECYATYVTNEEIIQGRGWQSMYCTEAEFCPHCGAKMDGDNNV